MATPLNRQLHPLKVNPQTNEVYLRLPAPHINIIITPPRMSDAAVVVQHLNDPSVYKMLCSPPFPYLMEHAESWLALEKKKSDAILQKLEEAAPGTEPDNVPLIDVDGCPVQTLREIQEDGSELYLGNVALMRCSRFGHLRDKDDEEALISRNAQLPAGDPQIIWEIGDHLASSHHGKGIMTAAVQTIIRDWAIPRMNAHVIQCSAFSGNIGSVKVFLKNGFEEFDYVDGCVTIPDSKGGGTTGLHFLVWRRPT